MQINTKDPNPPTKFYFNDDNPEEGFMLLRTASPAVSEEFRKQCSKKQPPEYRHRQRFELPDKVDQKLLNEKIWDYSIVEWEGLTDQNKKPIPVTLEMKVFLLQNVPDITRFVTKCMATLEANPNIGQDERLKNSPSTSQD